MSKTLKLQWRHVVIFFAKQNVSSNRFWLLIFAGFIFGIGYVFFGQGGTMLFRQVPWLSAWLRSQILSWEGWEKGINWFGYLFSAYIGLIPTCRIMQLSMPEYFNESRLDA
jgi:hypothetical protein